MENKICIDCEEYPVCMLQGRFADDPICENFKEEPDLEELGNLNNKSK